MNPNAKKQYGVLAEGAIFFIYLMAFSGAGIHAKTNGRGKIRISIYCDV